MIPACSSDTKTTTPIYTSGAQPLCKAWATISLGEYEISNNIWGKGNIQDYSQCIFGSLKPRSDLPDHFGWLWNWPDAGVRVKAYPSILFGRKPWNNYSTTSHLPRKIKKIKQLNVSYKLETTSNGAVNLLLESWITRIAKTTPTDRVAELAIQLYQDNWPGQAGRFIRSVVIDGISFDFYVEKKMRVPGDTHTWVYYGFVHKGKPVLQTKIDMMKFVNYLVNNGYVDQEHYIATVELGNEIDYGKGKTKVEQFSVQVKY